MFDINIPDIFERAKTLDTVARWLVRDLVDRTQQRSPVELTDAAFAVVHSEHGGRRLERHETALIAEYNRIRRDIVEPLLRAQPSGAISTSSSSTPPPPVPAGAPVTAQVPKGYKKHRNGRGLSRYSIREGGPRLEVALRDLRQRGVLSVEDHEIDTFQRMANVETGGGVQALNTWDSGVVSIGWFQLTLQHGKLQDLIRLAPDAFRRYGIEVDEGRTYTVGDEKPVAIRGAATAGELRWNGWADRFYRAGLDAEVIRAEVADGRKRLAAGLDRAKAKLGATRYAVFKQAYDGSLPLRGLYQESLNNLPVGAYNSLIAAAKLAEAAGVTDPAGYYGLLKRTTPVQFAAFGKTRNKEQDYREKGEHLVEKTATLVR